MKIAVYKIETVTPKDENQKEDFCDILNLPTLKYGSAEFIGKFSHWITKGELKKMTRASYKGYDLYNEIWRDGLLLIDDGKMFAQFAGKL